MTAPLLPFVLILTVTANTIIGTFVLVANSSRIQNRLFAAFAFLLSVWTAGVLVVVTTTHANVVEVAIRLLTSISTLLPVVFHAFCYSIVNDTSSARSIFVRIRYHLLLSLFFGALCFTPAYVSGVEMRAPATGGLPLPVAITGPGYVLVNGYIMLGLLVVAIIYLLGIKQCDALRRTELGFTLLGISLGVAVALLPTLVLPFFFPGLAAQRFGPLGLIPMNLTIAYGIATRRLLNVSMLLQRLSAYALLTVYLCILYFVVVTLTRIALRPQFGDMMTFPHLLATLVVVFSMAPVQGILQRISRKLFINVPVTDVRKAARMGSEVFASISTTDEIIGRFHDVLSESGIDAENIHIYLRHARGFEAHAIGLQSSGSIPFMDASSTMLRLLRRTKSPLAADVLKRVRQTEETQEAAADLSRLKARVAAGVFSKNELRGVVTMGQRRSGLIYTGVEQDALQILCNQLGVALENARLYTEVRNNQIYNDTLVNNLISGLVAVDAEGNISVFNIEAQRITGLERSDVWGGTVHTLPAVLADALDRALASGESTRNVEAALLNPHSEDEDEEAETPIRLSASAFKDARDATMGAFLVFTDLTTLRKLEQQVRRSDRLASIGTLSAGMAHEIKNPLVTIKTFTELLPERYQDADFRDTFSSLVSQEVERIDRIVNEVLHFARPAKPDLKPTSLRELLATSLRLLQEQMKQKGLRLETNYAAEADMIRADTGLLSQALLNFFLNAFESMDEQGTLTVTTSLEKPGWHPPPDGDRSEEEAYVHLTIQDSGSGIPADMLDRIFDPFFTTKSHGTGLGLSVSHGIIQDHLGLIECTSNPGQGTAFHIYFPLVRQEAAT